MLVLASCGGGSSNNLTFTSVVSYGDSLSDLGTYQVGTVAAAGGGKFTVNSPTAKVWPELVAAQYGLPAPCAAQTGLLSIIPGVAAVPVQEVSACRNYAQGSSRITNPAGLRSVAIQQGVLAATGSQEAAIAAAGLGLMAVPVVNQMASHLSRVGSYSGTELVTVLAGPNDVFMQLNGVASAAAGDAGAVGAGMTQAGNELVAAVKTQLLAKGAKYVVVVNVPDMTQTPFLAPADTATKGIVSQLISTFNSIASEALSGQAGVLLVDFNTQGRDQYANPAKYGVLNVTVPACSTTSPANPLAGSSLTCTAASLIAGDTSSHLFADDVHPTPLGHQLLANFIMKSLTAAGWL